MPKMISLRNYRLATLAGPIFTFKAKVPRDVSPECVQAALAAGCALVDPNDQQFIDDVTKNKVAFGGDARKSLLFLACQELIKENDPKKFTAGGIPRVPAIEALLGFDVNAKEITEAFQAASDVKRNSAEFELHSSAEPALRVIRADGRDDLLMIAMDLFDEEFNQRLEGLETRQIRTAMLNKLANNAA